MSVKVIPEETKNSTPLTGNFDPILHKPPRFDIYGKLIQTKAQPGEDPRNILKDKDKISIFKF